MLPLGRYFNIINFPNERRARGRLTLLIREFSCWVRSNNLVDLHMTGAAFNGQIVWTIRICPRWIDFYVRWMDGLISSNFAEGVAKAIVNSFSYSVGSGSGELRSSVLL